VKRAKDDVTAFDGSMVLPLTKMGNVGIAGLEGVLGSQFWTC
jgi:hypothetical protein